LGIESLNKRCGRNSLFSYPPGFHAIREADLKGFSLC